MGSAEIGPSPSVQTVRVAIVQCSELNCEALITLFNNRPDIVTVWSGTSLAELSAACRRVPVDVVLIDAIYDGQSGLSVATELIRDAQVRAVMLLDDRVDPGRSAAAAGHDAIAYFTRSVSFEVLYDGIRALAEGRRPLDPTIGQNGTAVTNRSRRPPCDPTVARIERLTPREKDVMRLIAMGKTVRDCAEILHLAQSTVDNHKTRLMKKLDVHKSSDLTRLAIRAGLISA